MGLTDLQTTSGSAYIPSFVFKASSAPEHPCKSAFSGSDSVNVNLLAKAKKDNVKVGKKAFERTAILYIVELLATPDTNSL